ncbi:DUF4190 domain-containing protein [bacterium]|nr:DUF4190 domain-containing protein [bacterium]
MDQNPYGKQPPPTNPYSQPQSPQKPLPNSHYPKQYGPQVSPLAILSLVFGIISLPFNLCCGCVPILSLAAVICGCIAINQCHSGAFTGKGIAIAGVVCGSIGLLIFVLLLVLQIMDINPLNPANLRKLGPRFNDI